MISGRFILLSLVFCLSVTILKGQEMLGTSLGNYSGVDGIRLNPSSIQHSKTYLDVRLAGGDIFLQNNYLYIAKEDYRFLNFFKKGYELPSHMEEYGTEERNFYHYPDKKGKNLYQSLTVNGPGAMLVYGRHGLAVTTAFRSVVSLRKVPYDVANFSYLGLNFRPQHNINYQNDRPFREATLAWGEIGLTYSCPVYARAFDKITAGITVRRLFGVAGSYIYVRSIDYIVPDDSTLNVKNINATAGISLPMDYSNNQVSLSPLFRGGGFGFDIGFSYVRLKRYYQKPSFTSLCSQQQEDYIFRIGIALIDVGAVRFGKNAVVLGIYDRPSYWENVNNIQFESLQQMMDTISYKFYGNNTEAYRDDRFLLWLPAALSIQGDYHYRDNWYINGSVICGFNISKSSLTRPSQVCITPRYETGWFEANLPVSLYDWTLLRIGLSLRFYGLTIGTEKLGGYFHFNDFTGLDFYFSLRYFLDKGNCRAKPEKCLERSRYWR